MFKFQEIIKNPELIKNYTYTQDVPLICEACKATFLRNKLDLTIKIKKGRKKSYCSKQCSYTSTRKTEEIKCTNCQKAIFRLSSHIGTNNFCGHTCSAIFNNTGRKTKKYVAPLTHCLFCNKSLFSSENKLFKTGKKYCNHKCHHAFVRQQKIEKWLSNENVEATPHGSLPNHIYNYIRNFYENKCSRCGWNEINEQTKKSPLNIHHIDGNYRNNRFDNLELLCPNCHSLTHNYGSLNKGKGREFRYKKALTGT